MINALRIVHLVMAVYIATAAFFVMVVYAKRTSFQDRRKRLLPWHVAVVAASYLGYVMLAVVDSAGRFGTYTWRVWFYFPAGVLGTAAMVLIVHHILHAGNTRGPQ